MELSIEQSLLDPGVRVDATVAQKWPVRAMLVDPPPIDFADHDFFLVDRSFRNDLAVRTANETLPPKFNSIAAGRRFMTDAVRCGHVAAVRDCVTTLDRFPGRMLGRSKFFFLARMPPDRRRIENNLRAAQCR